MGGMEDIGPAMVEALATLERRKIAKEMAEAWRKAQELPVLREQVFYEKLKMRRVILPPRVWTPLVPLPSETELPYIPYPYLPPSPMRTE